MAGDRAAGGGAGALTLVGAKAGVLVAEVAPGHRFGRLDMAIELLLDL